MNKKNLVPAAGIAALVLCLAVSAGRSAGRSTQVEIPAALPAAASESQYMSLDEIELRFRRSFDRSSPGSYRLAVDENARTITVDQWSPGFNADAVNAALADMKYFQEWGATVASVAELGAQMQDLVSDHGHPDYTVLVRVVNCDDTDQVFAVVSGGQVVYDIVDATPAGERVADPADRAAVSEPSRFIVNTSTMRFHLPGCSYAEAIAPEHRGVFTGDRADLIAQGFDPCDWCRP